MAPRFARATPEHARQVAQGLRADDYREMATLGVVDAEAEFLANLKKAGDMRAVLDAEGRAQALIGAQEIAPNLAAPWMVCTDEIGKCKRLIIRHMPRWVRAWAKRWGKLQNASDARNHLHHRFIEHCGFQWTGEARAGGYPFKIFELCASQQS